jgi:PAP2 superfamily
MRSLVTAEVFANCGWSDPSGSSAAGVPDRVTPVGGAVEVTSSGQALENAALRGADEASLLDSETAERALGQITVYSLAAAVVVLRRRWDLAVAGMGVIVAGQVVVQVLKRFLLVRPELVAVTGPYEANSLPSGHTTIAMTVLFGALIVVPYRWRGVAMVLGLVWATGIGAYTLTAKWHRLSDTLAADGIALALACAASWWLARRGSVAQTDQGRRVPRVVIVVITELSLLLSVTIGAILWGVTFARVGFDEALRDYAWNIYLGATSFASAGSLITALVFWATWRRLDTARPAAGGS